jgi:multimeric flavodoxin WrbA
MKVVAFNGSARQNGNTAILIRTALRELEDEGIETELVQFAGQKIQGCIACRRCMELRNERCALEDDPVNEWIGKMVESDGVILGSPVYFADLTASMKAFIERAGLVGLANGALFKHKAGAGLTAVRRGGAIHAFDSLNHFFFISQMVVPGANYWNMGIGLEIGDVEKDEEGMNTMRVLGQNMAWLLKKIGS